MLDREDVSTEQLWKVPINKVNPRDGTYQCFCKLSIDGTFVREGMIEEPDVNPVDIVYSHTYIDADGNEQTASYPMC